MKFINQNVGILSNAEMQHVLSERGAGQSKGRALASERLALKYLSSQPTRQLSQQQLKALHEALQPYKLSRGELLQITNLAPHTAVEVHLIVDDCEARLGEEGVAAVIEVVGSMLYKAPPPPDEAAEGEL